MTDNTHILVKQREWLDIIQQKRDTPVLVKARAGHVPPGCPSNEVQLYLWVHYKTVWSRLDRPIWTRGVRPDEICFDPDQKSWALMKRETDKILSFCGKNSIPYILGYSGGNGCHVSIFMNTRNIPISEELGKKIKEYDVDVMQVVRSTVSSIILTGSGADPGENGLSLDPKKLNFRHYKNGSQIREFGSVRDEMIEGKDGVEQPDKFYGNVKTLIPNIPDTIPEPRSLPLIFPTEIREYDVAIYEYQIISAIETEVRRCEMNYDYNLADMSFSDTELKDFPCVKKLLANGRTTGRYYGVQTIVLAAKLIGTSWVVASKKARDFLDKCDGLTPQDKQLRIDNVKSLFESDYHLSCRVVRETFKEGYCNFNMCTIKKKTRRPEDESREPFYHDEAGIHRRTIKRFKDGSTDISVKCICTNPAWLTRIGDNVDDKGTWCEVSYKDALGRDKTEWVSMKMLLSRDVIELTGHGLRFTDADKGDINAYFLYALDYQKPKPTVFVNKYGWKTIDGKQSFVIGPKMYSDDGSVVDVMSTIGATVVDAFTPAGTLDEWVRCMKPFLKYERARFIFYCAATPPILKWLDVQSFWVHSWGGSGAGKTIPMRAALSMMARPKSIEQSANPTKTGAERHAELFSDLPIGLDETSLVDKDVLEQLIYLLSNEKGKLRGKKDGGLQESASWKTVALTTGESDVTSNKTLEGAQVRNISIKGGLGVKNEESKVAVDLAQEGYKKNWGHLYPLLIQKIMEGAQYLEDSYKFSIVYMGKQKNTTYDRMVKTFAAIAVAGTILESVFGDIGIERMDAKAIVKKTLFHLQETRPIEDIARRALEVTKGWIDSNTKYIEQLDENGDPRGNSQAIYTIKGWHLWAKVYNQKDETYEAFDLPRHILEEFLEAHDFNVERCLSDWRDAGVIVCDPGRFTCQCYHGYAKAHCIRFRAEALEGMISTQYTGPNDDIQKNNINRKIESIVRDLNYDLKRPVTLEEIKARCIAQGEQNINVEGSLLLLKSSGCVVEHTPESFKYVGIKARI